MAARCNNTYRLEIHHINRGAGNTLSNAIVLCHKCHENTYSYGRPGSSPEDFPQSVKDQALKKAGNRCQCTANNCH